MTFGTARVRRAFAALAVAVVASGGAVLLTAEPASALPICTTSVKATGRGGLWLEVPGTASGSSSCFLARGDVSDAVWALQFALNRCYGKSLKLDGVFGNNTYNALYAVQGVVGARQDGVYGTETRGKMKLAGTVNGCDYWAHDGWT